ncbi:hypothetical protein [Nocardia araoensis]|uniref:hypothetical protein n=1 Tax=Nocardia araoensis TaxID=228600 RepID=UPI0012F7079B|nr:hypothetical protein [Nocardia araoensis]
MTDKDGNLKYEALPVIVRPPSRDVGDIVADAIESKSAKVKEYMPGLTHVNLVVCDRASAGPDINGTYQCRELLTSSLRKALDQSEFSEVYLFSVGDSGDQTVRPLRAITLLTLCMGVLEAFGPVRHIFDPLEGFDDLHAVCIQCAASYGISLGYTHEDGGALVYGGCGVRFNEKGIMILDYNDLRFPSIVQPPTSALSPETVAQLVSRYIEFATKNHAVLGFMFTAKQTVEETLLELRSTS